MAGVVVVVAGLVGLAPVANARPGSLRCGATITRDTTLRRDLLGCPDHGIVIGADNITLDLNGHRLTGDRRSQQECADDAWCGVGVLNDSHRRISVTGGSIAGFTFGVVLESADRNRLSRLSVVRNERSGVVVVGSSRLRVERNSISENGVETGATGMATYSTLDAVIKNNLFRGNGDEGLFALESSSRNRITDNVFSGDTESGIVVDGDANDIASNRIDGGAIILGGDDNRLRKNVVADPPVCDDGCGIGISFEHGTRNLIERNVLLRAPVRGIRVDAYGAAATNTVIRRNVVRDALGDGIAIDLDHAGEVSGTVIDHNLVTGSGDDGVDVESPTTTVRNNVVRRNGDLGIEAVPGVVDGGGNHAYANGNPLQCTTVRCSTERGVR